MRFALALLMMIAPVGCESADPDSHASHTGGARLEAPAVGFDGIWLDRELQTSCQFADPGDGQLRCLPVTGRFAALYLDPGCRVELFRDAPARGLLGLADGLVIRFARSPATGGYAELSPVAPDATFALIDGACEPRDSFGAALFRAGAAVELAAFQPGEEVLR